jgi:hypothetical protein
VYEITIQEEYTKVNNMTRVITVVSGVTTRAADLSLTDTVKGTYSMHDPTQRRSAPHAGAVV